MIEKELFFLNKFKIFFIYTFEHLKRRINLVICAILKYYNNI